MKLVPSPLTSCDSTVDHRGAGLRVIHVRTGMHLQIAFGGERSTADLTESNA